MWNSRVKIKKTQMNFFKIILSIIFLLGMSFNSTSFAQEVTYITEIAEDVHEVLVDLKNDGSDSRLNLNKLINAYNRVDGIVKVELLKNDQVKIRYTKSKLNGPGIFLGLAMEMNFEEVKFIESK